MHLPLKNNYDKIGDMLLFRVMKLKRMVRYAWLVLYRLARRRAVGRDMRFRLHLDVEIEMKAQEGKNKGEVEQKKSRGMDESGEWYGAN